MGRPFSIDVDQFTQALASYFKVTTNRVFETERQLFEAFSQVYKIHRTPIWNHVAQLLGKSKQQVKNFYFNTWATQFEPAAFNENKDVHSSYESASKDSLVLEKQASSSQRQAQDDEEYLYIQRYPVRPMLLKFSDFKVQMSESILSQRFPAPDTDISFISFIM
ncbi:Conserved_hypothetical protein [Hexamita inflata]|uniref:Uncharacterized protein n=1 Tax=Hexamita inflata TaxID=28002 RepID=A0AA86Q098_9EUKA|nr:Conserved hypothetical protein [Hexamita inflata]CAI9949687.1 Conserved hypothetical protein [Hexamita inflata]